jgi:putative transposase
MELIHGSPSQQYDCNSNTHCVRGVDLASKLRMHNRTKNELRPLFLNDVSLYAYQLMSNHWHLVLRPNQDGAMSQFIRWVTATHTMRYHARYHSSGQGHVYQGRFKSFPIQDDGHFLTVCRYVERNALRANLVARAEEWRWGSLWRWLQTPELDPPLLSPWPIPRLPGWVDRVNAALTDRELMSVQESAQRGRPFGDLDWVESSVKRLGLQSTINPRGRPSVQIPDPN